MKKLVLILAGLSALSACSDHRERRVSTSGSNAPAPDLTLPDTNLARDTSTTASSRTEQPISPIEQQTNRAESPKSKPATVRRKHTVTAVRRSNPSRDTAVKAYAPNVATNTPAPTSPARDTAADIATVSPVESVIPVDTARAAAPDTAISPHPDSVKATTPGPDTTKPSDTAATRLPDRASTPRDTTAKAVDSSNTHAADSGSETHPSQVAAASPTNTSSSSAAARTLPIGTEIHAALDDSITSRRDTVGQKVSGHVMENVLGAGGQTLIAAGTPVRFTITRIRPSRSKSSQGRLALQTDGITLNGRLQPVQADIQPVPRELRGRGVTGSEAAKVGGGAAAGAVLGRVVGGNTKGAVIGGVAGAAAGAVVANQTATRDVVVKAKTPLVLVLTEPLVAP
jgi:glycine zipper 2TM protein